MGDDIQPGDIVDTTRHYRSKEDGIIVCENFHIFGGIFKGLTNWSGLGTAVAEVYNPRAKLTHFVPVHCMAPTAPEALSGLDEMVDHMVPKTEAQEHPLYPILMQVIDQAMHGKGTRHGGCETPFMEQPWCHYAKLHGRGFLTGQAAKKLEEASSTKEGEAFTREVLGAIAYCGMALLHEQQKGDGDADD